MKSYGTRATVPQRMARKRMRRDVFVANSKATKLRRKAVRLLKRKLEQEEV